MKDTKATPSDHIGTKLLISAIALVTAAGLAVNGLFQSPAELIREEPAAIVVSQSDGDFDGEGDAGESDESPEDEKGRHGGLRRLLRQRILALPLALRLLVILPLWGLGSGVMALVTALCTAVSPLLGKIIGMLLMPALLFLCFLLAVKTVFPDLPIRRIINRKTVPCLLLGSLALGAVDAALVLWVEDYSSWRSLALSLALLVSLSAFVGGFVRREHRRKTAVEKSAAVAQSAAPLIFDLPGGRIRFRS